MGGHRGAAQGRHREKGRCRGCGTPGLGARCARQPTAAPLPALRSPCQTLFCPSVLSPMAALLCRTCWLSWRSGGGSAACEPLHGGWGTGSRALQRRHVPQRARPASHRCCAAPACPPLQHLRAAARHLRLAGGAADGRRFRGCSLPCRQGQRAAPQGDNRWVVSRFQRCSWLCWGKQGHGLLLRTAPPTPHGAPLHPPLLLPSACARQIQREWSEGGYDLVVATIAFGESLGRFE